MAAMTIKTTIDITAANLEARILEQACKAAAEIKRAKMERRERLEILAPGRAGGKPRQPLAPRIGPIRTISDFHNMLALRRNPQPVWLHATPSLDLATGTVQWRVKKH